MRSLLLLLFASLMTSCSSLKYTNYAREDYEKLTSEELDSAIRVISREKAQIPMMVKARRIVAEYDAGRAIELAKAKREVAAWEYPLVEKRRLAINMSERAVVYSWGKPDRVNATVTGGGRSEQWVYDRKGYAYIMNGRLNAFQTRR